jgi:SMI1 / KNR4 family (SUKH-1)
MEIHAKLQKLIHELIEAKREYYRLAFDREPRMKLGAPCSPEQLARLAAILGKPLPPSYRAFLELHNGWDGFDGDTKLLAVEDHEQAWVKNRVKTLSSLLEEYADENPFKEGAMPVLLGEDERAFTVLDPRKVRKNGEMDFVTFDLMQEQDRFKDFISFLEDDLVVTQELIEDEKKGTPDEEDEEDEEED